MAQPKKQQKTYRQNVVKKTKMVSKRGGAFHAGDVPKISKIHKFAKMDPRDVPGSKKHPKGAQKASKWHPKTIPKTFQISQDSTPVTQILKSQCKELQRTLHPIRASQLQQNHKAFSMSTFHAGVQV